ncbi:MAG: hypothetical protein HN590_11210 [Calditrichaeota bacterium]|nr:hypothetical protein [Calditrichota bacterium]
MKTTFLNFEKQTVTAILILAVLASMQITFAQTEVDGEVAGVWDREGSPFIAVEDILVAEGEELIIEPGVEVQFQARRTMTVLGTLTAAGEAENLIRFSSFGEDPEIWGSGLCFEGDESRVSLDYSIIENQIVDTNDEDWLNRGGGIRILGGVHQINNSVIQNCQAGIGGGLYLNGGLCEVGNSEFIENQARTTGGGVFSTAGLKLIDCRLFGNSTGNEDQPGMTAIYIGQEDESDDSLVVTGCRLEGNLETEMAAFGIANVDCPHNFAFNEIIDNDSPGFVFINSGFGPALIIDHFTIYGNTLGVGGGTMGDAIVTNSIL